MALTHRVPHIYSLCEKSAGWSRRRARCSRILRFIGEVLVMHAAHAQRSIRHRQGCSMHAIKIVTNIRRN